MRLNTQPREPVVEGDGSTLDVVEIWKTLQGEGPSAGRPAVFIRLAGCVKVCKFCDTDYTTRRRVLPLGNVHDEVDRLAHTQVDLVVITGGEPFRQPLRPLIERLIPHYHVQVETSGSVQFNLVDLTTKRHGFTVVCSPKQEDIPPNLYLHHPLFKYVLREGHVDPNDGLPTEVLGMNFRPARPAPFLHPKKVFVQPCDEQDEGRNKLNLQACVESCMRFGYRLSLQMHKIIGLP